MAKAIRARIVPSVLALGLLAGGAAEVRAQDVGTAGAVNPASHGTPPAGSQRVLEVGARIVHKERIRTSDKGSLQLLFVDKTTLNIGPNSDLVIDEFVYDPRSGTGKMSATLVKGALRFVGGQVSHGGNATLKTPVMTLGVRGGVVTLRHDQREGSRAINHFGTLTVSTAGGSEVVRRPGFGVSVPSLSALPSPPQRIAQAEIDASNRQLTSGPKQSGGAQRKPTDGAVAGSGVAQANAAVTEASTEGQRQTVARHSDDQALRLALAQNSIENLQLQAGAETTNAATGGGVWRQRRALFSPGSAGKGAVVLVTAPDPRLGSSVPYVLGTGVATGSVSVSPIWGYRQDGVEADGKTPRPLRTLQVAFGIEGQGASQKSDFMVADGELLQGADGRSFYSGAARYMTQSAANRPAGRGDISISSVPGSMGLGADGMPTGFTINQNGIDAAGNPVPTLAGVRPTGSQPLTDYAYEQAVTRGSTPAGLGEHRPASLLTGLVGGIVRTTNDATGMDIETPQPLFGGGGLMLDPDGSRLQFNVGLFVTRDTAMPEGGMDDAQLQFGNIGLGPHARSTYIDYDRFGAREGVMDGTIGSTGAPVSTVNGQTVDRDWMMMASSGTIDTARAFPGTTFCKCEYTRWGFWSSEIRRYGANGVQYSDRVHLGTWVAGQMPDAAEMPATGIATYSGHVMASFSDGSSQYVAAGNLTNTINFGSRTGAVTVTNLDGRNYAGTVNIPASTPAFTGNLATTAGPSATMDMVGFFYRGPGGPVQEMGGHVAITGSNYFGSGIFAGRAN